MITQTYDAKTKVVYPFIPTLLTHTPTQFSPQDLAQAKARDISPEEYVRRNNIIKNLSDQVKLRPGDTAYPDSKAGYQKYGACIVIGICRSYKDFGFDETWPENDCPYIITFAPLNDRKSHIHCTYHYLVAKNPHLVTC